MKTDKKEKVIGVRLTAAQYENINRLAEERYLTVSKLGSLLFEKYLRSEIKIKGLTDIRNP